MIHYPILQKRYKTILASFLQLDTLKPSPCTGFTIYFALEVYGLINIRTSVYTQSCSYDSLKSITTWRVVFILLYTTLIPKIKGKGMQIYLILHTQVCNIGFELMCNCGFELMCKYFLN